MPWMTRGDRRREIPKEVVSVWAECGWVLETAADAKPVPVPIPAPTPTPEKTK